MTGVDATTGRPLAGLAHLAQSIRDILTTPLGTRVMRRDYGSELHELVDAPMNAVGRLRLIAATAGAIRRWEPRVRLTGATIAGGADGQFAVDLAFERLDLPEPTPAALSISLRN